MTEIPNRVMKPDELKRFKLEKELEKKLFSVDEEYTKRSEIPSKWAGRLTAIFVVALFIDISGWMVAFLSGSFYAFMAMVLQATETVCVVGLAAFAIRGSIEAYRLQEEKKRVTEEFWAANQ